MKIAAILAAGAFALTSPALAQEMDHSMHMDHGHQHDGMAMPEPEAEALPPEPEPAPMDHMDHGAHGGHDHAMPATSGQPDAPASAPADHSGHASHDHTAPPAEAPVPAPMDHSSHSGHNGSAPKEGDPPKRPADAAAFSGPVHAADLAYDPAAMAAARSNMLREHGDITVAKLLVDRIEARLGDGKDGLAWEADAWIGKDLDKLWIKSEGESDFGESPGHAEIQALWSHAIGPWFDLQLGARHDFRPDPERTYAVVGVQGLAPYWFEVNGAVFLSDKGDVTARADAEYDLRVTNRLIAQPRLEVNLSAQKALELGLGSGLSSAALGLRLRYEFTPQFAPYIGVEWERKFGRTKRYAKADGEDPSRPMLVLGTRFWF